MRSIQYLILLATCLILNSCIKEFSNDCITSADTIERRAIELNAAITKIDLQVPANLIVNEGAQFIEIEAPGDVIDKLIEQSEINGDEWSIELRNCYDGGQINIWITLPQFEALDVSGSGNISSSDTLRDVTSLNLEIQGSGDIDVQVLDAEKLDLEIQGSGNISVDARNVLINSYHINGSGDIDAHINQGESGRMEIDGSGDIEASGTLKDQRIEISGQGDIRAFDLCLETCVIDSKGSGSCNVKVSERLTVTIEGSGDICYRGQPAVTSTIDGSGSIKDCN